MTDWQKRRQKTHEQAYKDLPGVSRGAIHSLIERGYRDGQADTLERIKPLLDALEFYAGKKDGEWVAHVCDSYSGLNYAFDWNGDTQDEPYEVAREAIENWRKEIE